MLNQEQKALLWLSNAEISAAHVKVLVEEFGSAEAVWDVFDQKGAEALHLNATARERLSQLHSQAAMDDLCDMLEKRKVRLLFQTDEAYPSALMDIVDPPYLLYYAGRTECLRQPMIAIVGSRKSSTYGYDLAHGIARGIAEAGVCVVSGLARGIDEAAHLGALEAGGRTIGIMGSGLNIPYPPEHTTLLRQIAGGIGLVISEYPLDAPPKPFHFPYRNRLISGLSRGVVLVEGRMKSGTMHTINAALEQGRTVYAVPGRVGASGSEGPHALLRDGARIITCAEDLLDDLGIVRPESKAEKPVELDGKQRRLMEALGREPLGIVQLSKELGMEEMELMIELGTLEILGVIRRESGNRFRKA